MFHFFHNWKIIDGYLDIEYCDGCQQYKIFNITCSLDEGDWYYFTEKELVEIKSKIDEVRKNRMGNRNLG